MNLKLMIGTILLCIQAATTERRGRQDGGHGGGTLGHSVISITDKLNSCHLCQHNNHPRSLDNNMPFSTTLTIMAKLVTARSAFGLLCFCQV